MNVIAHHNHRVCNQGAEAKHLSIYVDFAAGCTGNSFVVEMPANECRFHCTQTGLVGVLTVPHYIALFLLDLCSFL